MFKWMNYTSTPVRQCVPFVSTESQKCLQGTLPQTSSLSWRMNPVEISVQRSNKQFAAELIQQIYFKHSGYFFLCSSAEHPRWEHFFGRPVRVGHVWERELPGVICSEVVLWTRSGRRVRHHNRLQYSRSAQLAPEDLCFQVTVSLW